MKTNRMLAGWLTLLAFSTLNPQFSTVFAQGTAFTYQGKLVSGGNAASGVYDFTFAVWNAASGGAQQGATFATNAVPVTNGYFIATLDFGNDFKGNALWLEIGVRTNGVSSFTTLSPRQALTPAPYAIFANTASNLSGTLPAGQLNGSVGNGQLANSSITVTAGAGLSGGGAVPLGGSTTLANTGVLSLTGNADITTSTVNGAVTLGDTATSDATANTLVKRDATGSFSATSLSLSGNLNLPATAAAADTIYSGSFTLLQADNNYNFFAGIGAGNLTMSGGLNVGIGDSALSYNTSGMDNTAIGFATLEQNTTGNNNTATGYGALVENTTGRNNTAIGFSALTSNTNGINNTAVGGGALSWNTSGSTNIALGFQAGYNLTTGSNNIDIGNQGVAGDNGVIRIGNQQTQAFIAGVLQAGNNYNFFAGVGAGNLTMSGGLNVGIGDSAFYNNTSGMDNTAIGFGALEQNTTGNNNTATGEGALVENTTGRNNTAIGVGALTSNTNGINNTAVGVGALFWNTSGSTNIALGFQAGYNLTTGSNNIDIGNQGIAGDNGVIRIGTPGANTTTYLTGNIGIDAPSPAHKLVVQADDGSGYLDGQQFIIQGNTNTSQQLELGYKTSGNYGSIQAVQQNVGFKPLVLQPAGGNVGIGTTSPGYPLTMNSGAYCSSAGVWTSVSDRNAKENFTAISPRAVLEKVSALPITEWKYKVEADGTEHLGPMAQDFHAAFGLNGSDDKHIATVDEEGVALAAIQGLNQKFEEQSKAKDAEIEALKQSVAELKKMVQLLTEKK